jgi:hypothetical protein
MAMIATQLGCPSHCIAVVSGLRNISTATMKAVDVEASDISEVE